MKFGRFGNLEYLRRPASWGVFLLAVIGGAAMGRYIDSSEQIDPLLVIGVLALVAATLLGVEDYRRRQRRSERRAAQLQAQNQRIRAEERLRLAHELHDVVAHDVTTIAMQARRAEIVTDPQKTTQILQRIDQAAQHTLDDLRTMVTVLKTPADQAAGDDLFAVEASGETTTAEGLRHDLTTVTQALEGAGFDVETSLHGGLEAVPTGLRQALRRSLREIGTNILKHADPQQPVQLSITVDHVTVRLAAENTPSGRTPVMSTGTGLQAMASRAEALGGSFTTDDRNGRFHATITVPLQGVSA